MRAIFYLSVFVLLATCPATVFGFGLPGFFNLLDGALNIFERIQGLEIGNQNDESSQIAEIGELLLQRMTTYSEKSDKKFVEVLERIKQVPGETVFLLNKNDLEDSYNNINTYTNKYVLLQRALNRKPKLKILKNEHNVGIVDQSWNKVRNLITKDQFFSELSTKPDYYHNQGLQTVCYTDMSNAQAAQLLVNEFLNVATHYYIVKNIESNIEIHESGETIDSESVDYMIQRLFDNIQSEINVAMSHLINVVNKTSHDFWTCDKKEVNPKSPWFVELKAFTKYFTVRKNMPERCSYPCSDFRITECKSRLDNGLCERSRACPNELTACERISSDFSINFCLPNNTNSYRRFEVVSEGEAFKKKPCPIGHLIAYNGLLLYELGLNSAAIANERYFECVCREDQYVVNTSPVLADPDHVIVGAQLVVRNKTLHIVASQAEFNVHGYVINEKVLQPPVETAEWQINHQALNWDDKIHLAPAKIPDDHVITGLKFVKDEDGIYLRIQHCKLTKKFKLVKQQKWAKKVLGTEEYSFSTGEDRPDKSTNHTQHSKADQFVKFSLTGLGEDGGQSTIPFIDTQMVRPVPLTALSGLGLYVRGQEGYGGFLGIKLQTFNMASYPVQNSKLKHSIADIKKYLGSLGLPDKKNG